MSEKLKIRIIPRKPSQSSIELPVVAQKFQQEIQKPKIMIKPKSQKLQSTIQAITPLEPVQKLNKQYKQSYKISFTFVTTLTVQFIQQEGFPQHFFLPQQISQFLGTRDENFQLINRLPVFQFRISYENAQKLIQQPYNANFTINNIYLTQTYNFDNVPSILQQIELFAKKNKSSVFKKYNYLIELFEHQIQALNLARQFTKFAFLDSPGLGKSLPSLIFLLEKQKPIFIVAPVILHQTWIKTTEQLNISVLQHSSKQIDTDKLYKNQKINEYSMINYFQTQKITNFQLIFNNQAFQNLIILVTFTELQKLVNNGLNLKHSSILIDEFHEYKDTSAKRTQNLLNMCNIVSTLAILTATPASNNSAELFSILRVLGLNISLKLFQQRYCIMEKQKQYTQIIGSKNTTELSNILKLFSIRRSYDLLPIPSVKRVIFEIQTNQEYLNKQQNTPSLIQLNSTLPKLSQFIKFFDSFQYPCIAFFTSIQVSDELAKISATIDGRTSIIQRNELIKQFQLGQIKKLCLSLECANYGFDLAIAKCCFFIQMNWTAAGIIQAEGRIRRVSSKHKEILSVFVDGGSQQEKMILNIIQKKGELFERVYGEEKVEIQSVLNCIQIIQEMDRIQ